MQKLSAISKKAQNAASTFSSRKVISQHLMLSAKQSVKFERNEQKDFVGDFVGKKHRTPISTLLEVLCLLPLLSLLSSVPSHDNLS
uniref:Uncharacterized protein n=1 Tax=Parascaris univalens TaxID=6257 RepID=A0A915A3U8_PARUN